MPSFDWLRKTGHKCLIGLTSYYHLENINSSSFTFEICCISPSANFVTPSLNQTDNNIIFQTNLMYPFSCRYISVCCNNNLISHRLCSSITSLLDSSTNHFSSFHKINRLCCCGCFTLSRSYFVELVLTHNVFIQVNYIFTFRWLN